MNESTASSRLSKSSLIGYLLAILGAMIVLLSGYGYQWGWWGLGTAFRTVIPVGGLLAVVGLVVSLAGLYVSWPGRGKSGLWYAVTGLAFGLLTIATIGYWYNEAQKYPPIHDITTDTENPPSFEAIAPLRADAPNPVEYAGAETAAIQKEHYPELETIRLATDYGTAYELALKAAEAMPWHIVAESRQNGKIEAYHKLPWYGFVDDVVIRVDSVDTERVTIDVRSKSRIGRGDLGVNAWRIREYIEELKQQ